MHNRLFPLALLLPVLSSCAQGTATREDTPLSSNSTGDLGTTTVTAEPLPETAPEGTPVALYGQLRVEGTQLVAEDGTPVQLKGPSSMWLNWERTGYASNPEGVKFMRDEWGAMVIRAAMGIEPDGAYLSQPATAEASVKAVIDLAIRLGIYVIVDWHAHHAEETVDEAKAFFKMIAEEYGERPNILYEPFNEPDGAQDAYVDWPTVKAYHEQIVPVIREADPDSVIILGTPQWSQLVDEAAADPVAGDNLMYTLHFYSCTHTAWLRDKASAALADGLALFVTEWGASNADGGTPNNPEVCLEEGQLWVDWMATEKISWTAWKLDDCVDVTCYFNAGTSPAGGWTDDQLNGHGIFVRDSMQE